MVESSLSTLQVQQTVTACVSTGIRSVLQIYSSQLKGSTCICDKVRKVKLKMLVFITKLQPCSFFFFAQTVQAVVLFMEKINENLFH